MFLLRLWSRRGIQASLMTNSGTARGPWAIIEYRADQRGTLVDIAGSSVVKRHSVERTQWADDCWGGLSYLAVPTGLITRGSVEPLPLHSHSSSGRMHRPEWLYTPHLIRSFPSVTRDQPYRRPISTYTSLQSNQHSLATGPINSPRDSNPGYSHRADPLRTPISASSLVLCHLPAANMRCPHLRVL